MTKRKEYNQRSYKTLQNSPYSKHYYYHFTVLMYNENVFIDLSGFPPPIKLIVAI